MNYLQDNDGGTITIPDDVFLTKSIVKFLDFSMRGETSTDFQIPNDSETRKVIGFYSINQQNLVSNKPIHFFNNGNRISDGRLFIRSVGKTFDCYFVGGNTNWFELITGSIKDIDFTAFDLTFDAATIVSRMSATDGVIFPVMDWAYNYKKLSNMFLALPINGVSVDSYYDFYPCVYIHTIFEYIFAEYGIILSGNLIDDPIYNSVVITPSSILSSAYTSPITVYSQESMGYDRSTFPDPVLVKNVLTKLQMGFGTAAFDDANDRLVMPADYGESTIVFSIELAAFTGELYLYKNGASVASVISTVSVPELQGSAIVSGAAGDTYELYFKLTSVDRFYIRSAVEINIAGFGSTPGTVFVSSILPDIQQIDFVRYVAQRFNCLVDFDDLTQTIYFTLLDSLKKEDAVDMSEFIKDYQQVPSSGYLERNYIRTTPAGELVTYKQNNLEFGDQVVESEGIGEQEVLQTPLRPAETLINFNLDWLLTNVPLVRLEDADTGINYTTVTDLSGVAQFNGGTDLFANTNEVLRVDGSYEGFMVNSVLNPGTINPYNVKFTGTGTGKIYKQKIVFNQAGSRELIVIPNISIEEINVGSLIYGSINIHVGDEDNDYPIMAIAWPYFTKPNIGTDLDNYKIGLNYGPVLNSNSLEFGQMYMKNLEKIIQGSKVNCTMLLSQTQYYNLDLARLIFLRVKEFEGYFLISSVDGYKNQFTPVEMELIYMN